MSLIKPQNLAGPFTNKVHLFTILIVAVLFGVFRLAGGNVKSTSTRDRVETPKYQQERATPADSSPITMDNPRKEMGRLAGGKQAPAVDDELMAGINDVAPAKASPAAQPASSAALDDIEKSLGLR